LWPLSLMPVTWSVVTPWQVTPSQEQQSVLGFHEVSKEPEAGWRGRVDSGLAADKSLLSRSKAVFSLPTQRWPEKGWEEVCGKDVKVEFAEDKKGRNKKQQAIILQ
jgi:hypothetical protein